MNILERIDSAIDKVVAEADDEGGNRPIKTVLSKKSRVIDVNDQQARMRAIKNCKGPCVGWDDYVAGRDYTPPMYWKDKDGGQEGPYDIKIQIPYGPEDEGGGGIISPKEGEITKDNGEKVNFDRNPFSRKYGGVRPWAPGEVVLTMTNKSDEKANEGILYKVARKAWVSRAALAVHGKYDETDIDDAVMRGAFVVLRELGRDEMRDGVRFTSFLGAALQQGMKAGVPAGYHDEYRKARGLRRRIIPIAKQALKSIIVGGSTDDEIRRLDAEYAGIDSKPSPKNPYGNLVTKLYKVKDLLRRAMISGDASSIRSAIEETEKIFDKIAEEEESYRVLGSVTQGAVGKKSRDYGAMGQYRKAEELLEAQREIATRIIKWLRNGESFDTAKMLEKSQKLWDEFKTSHPENQLLKRHKKSSDKDDYGSDDEAIESRYDNPEFEAIEFCDSDAIFEGVYTSPFEKKQEDLPSSRGSIGLIAIKEKLDEAIRSKDIYKLEDFISMSENEQQLIKAREEDKARRIGAAGLTTTSDDTGKESERTNFAKKDAASERMNEEDREKLGMVISKVSPYRDDRLERKKHAEEASVMLDAISSAVDDYIAAKSEGVDTTKPKHDLANIARDLDSSLGEWRQEIESILRMTAGAIRLGSEFGDVRMEINDLKKIAKQDVKLQPSPNAVTVPQYRMLLRYYGISNYPERGTPDDPEIDENGEMSQWAAAGYPAVMEGEPGKKSIAYIWTDIYDTVDENGEHVPSVSSARISKQKGIAISKFLSAAEDVQQQFGESLGVDSIEYKMITEFTKKLYRMVVEDVLPGATKIIYG
ncbi:MAG: hypothetical protein M0R50_03130 [Candidatus Cloacimonetes bacterium]|jgi:hypothetical protein|nr:hypothetical protein [Candidatus Cloacimonadota bacterium]